MSSPREAATAAAALDALDRARDRREWVLCGGVLAAYAALRVVAVRHHALVLGNPEELVHLRLARQLAADLPLGTLDPYMYGPTMGGGGIGPIVMSLAYVPVSWFFGTGHAGLRGMALLWALASALLVGAIASHLFGRGGRLAGVTSCLLLPPAWLGGSSTLYANYFEGSTLALLGLYVFLVAGASTEGLRRRTALAFAFGLIAGFATAFSPAALALTGPILLFAVLLPGSWKHRAVTLPAAAGGAALGFLPWRPILFADRAGHLKLPDWRDSFRHLVDDRERWTKNLDLTFDSLPVHGIWEHQMELAVPAWAPTTWRFATFALLGLFALRGVLGGWFPGAAAWSAEKRAAAFLAGGVAIALPLALTLVGLGPDGIDAPRLYHWNWRRQVLVYPLAALAWAWALHGLVAPDGTWPRRALAAVLGVVPLAAGVAAVAVAFGGEAPPTTHRPQDYALCPEREPRFEGAVCVDIYTSWNQLDVVAALVDEVAFDRTAVRLTLSGFGSVHRTSRECRFISWKLPQPGIEIERRTRHAWRAAGAAIVATCGAAEDITPHCDEAPTPDLREACLGGARDFAEHAWDPGTGWTPAQTN